MKKLLLPALSALMISAPATAAEVVPADFENLTLSPESWWVGDVQNPDYTSGTFKSGSFTFTNIFNPDWQTWGFYGYANLTSNQYGGTYTFEDQMKNCVGGGYESANYAICYCDSYNGKAEILLDEPAVVPGVMVTNTAWVMASILNGDAMTDKFTEGDWVNVYFKGYDASGEYTGGASYYLANYRSTPYAPDFRHVADDWWFMDLTPLGEVSKIVVGMDTNKWNQYGMLLPAYVAIDNLGCPAPTNHVENTFSQSGQPNILISNGEATCLADGAVTIQAYSLTGHLLGSATGENQAILTLPEGVPCILRASTPNATTTRKLLR